ncbi:hypothetical protein VCR20J5_670219 [Vibrio crassostreae]|nr:hypothetical protein VCR15J5_50104 [Vibrio crassostreae]CDT44053.1 hypothetical protein VCR9J2_700321 [Vibrio crassostreae]CDT58801.1 hypothetical protein VCR20J5_670219 [Vibrio crassostreae]
MMHGALISSRTAASKTLALTLRCRGFSFPEAFLYLGDSFKSRASLSKSFFI